MADPRLIIQRAPVPSSRFINLKQRHPSSSYRFTNLAKSQFFPTLSPTLGDITLASPLPVIGENLQPIPFGTLFADRVTIVCFIRHFHCAACQDYVTSLIATANPAARKIFNCPFPIYTDPTRRLYRAMGMTLRTLNAGTAEEVGDYVAHGSLSGLLMALGRAMKMPFAYGGSIKQLGGEFVLGPGLTCRYAHRMHTTRSHASGVELLEHAGVDMNPIPQDIRHLVDPEEEKKWMNDRNRKMNEIRMARLARRGYISWTDKYSVIGSSEESICCEAM